MHEIPCDITDPLGLHIQLAVLLASEAERWRSDVTLEHERKRHPELPPLPEALAAVNRLWRPTYFSR